MVGYPLARFMKKLKVLIGCEESQEVCKAFRQLGHEAYSCDIQDCSGGHPEWHIKADILDVLFNDNVSFYKIPKKWDIFIGHPTCTRLCNSGVMWLDKRNLWKQMEGSAKFFKRLLNVDIDKVCIENPIPHKYALKIIGKKYDQIIQPWMFGHGETKATCLWLKNLPKLIPTNLVNGRIQRLHRLPPSKDRAKIRSKTYLGIAKAMAEQWGNLLPLAEQQEGGRLSSHA